ncbi:hypothetical protein SAMN05192583_3129 [Sphingomonas gellani]|uniref:Uncharacterized protein n=1 Tax=Sphingomonas gellani TaxID=1166340 RepID=A0A1H8HWS3_9SPHN|nr:hypothetical protein [Sphingomonas gellani]SEN60552.1 hypothetical protein SAMN05192583_3129 [Sphingomonas gellani]
MASASISRLVTEGRITVPSPKPVRSAERLSIAELPRAGHSPAIDLQRRLGEAALRGFYPAEPTRQGVHSKSYMIAGSVALVSWALIFSMGAQLIG